MLPKRTIGDKKVFYNDYRGSFYAYWGQFGVPKWRIDQLYQKEMERVKPNGQHHH